jgi:peptidoglycan/xylan/chitin deacetylase (PgdA/CDA1 family)
MHYRFIPTSETVVPMLPASPSPFARPGGRRPIAHWFIAAAIATSAMEIGPAGAADCQNPDALGTARILEVDAATTPQVGTKSFAQTLPLADKEVVLTFDDGPAATTPKVLDALRQQCVRATFFLVGSTAIAQPKLIRRMAAEGHSIGHHTWSHSDLKKVGFAEAVADIDRGIAGDESALHGKASSVPSTPFFRFPYFDSTPELLAHLQSRGIVVFGADLWASDWNPMTPQQQLKLITDRLDKARSGIILFHDPRPQTAAMIADFLRWLRDNEFRVVHIVAKAPAPRAELR